MKEAEPESRSEALTSSRRLLVSVADSVFPARSEPNVDVSGKERDVSQEKYVNRIMAFLEERIASRGSLAILGAELQHLALRLEAVREKASKGVHADVTRSEARLAVIHTYLIVAEIARLAVPASEQKPGV